MINIMEARLANFITWARRNHPIQRSTEWKDERRKTIGGSEISAALGKCRYKSPRMFMLEKTGIYTNDSLEMSPAIIHGVKYENVVQMAVELETGVVIKGTDIFIKGMDEYTSASPDGLSVNDDGGITLYEFKSPFSRKPVPNKPPANYVWQVKWTADVINRKAKTLNEDTQININRALLVECVITEKEPRSWIWTGYIDETDPSKLVYSTLYKNNNDVNVPECSRQYWISDMVYHNIDIDNSFITDKYAELKKMMDTVNKAINNPTLARTIIDSNAIKTDY